MTEIGGKITEIPGTESSPFFMVLNVFFCSRCVDPVAQKEA